MLNRVCKLLANVAIRVWLAALVPLLYVEYRYPSTSSQQFLFTCLVSHQALMGQRSCIPPFKIVFATLPRPHRLEVQKHHSIATLTGLRIALRYLPHKHELLRRRIGYRGEDTCAKLDAEVECAPVLVSSVFLSSRTAWASRTRSGQGHSSK